MHRALLPLILLLLAAGCGGEEEVKPSGPDPAAREQIRSQREMLTSLQNQASHLAQSVAELEVMMAKVNAVAERVAGLEQGLADYAQSFEETASALHPRSPQAAALRSRIVVFVLGLVLGMILIFLYQLFRVPDEGEFPAEAYTPGMTTTAPPAGPEGEGGGERG